MKKTDLNDTRALDIKSLKGKANNLRKEIAELVLQKNMNGIQDLKVIGKRRKDLSQTLTIMNQKKLLEMLGKEEPVSDRKVTSDTK